MSNITNRIFKKKSVEYNHWGYLFIAPFFLIYIVFSLIPLLSTIINSFFETYRIGIMQVGPNFVGLKNFREVLFNSEVSKYAVNTLIMWLIGFVPQIVFALLLSIWFTDTELNLKFRGFFKTVMYMPNLIMASAFAMLFKSKSNFINFDWSIAFIFPLIWVSITRGLSQFHQCQIA